VKGHENAREEGTTRDGRLIPPALPHLLAVPLPNHLSQIAFIRPIPLRRSLPLLRSAALLLYNSRVLAPYAGNDNVNPVR